MASMTNSADWSGSYSRYLARSAELSARSLQRYQLALEHISQGKLPPTAFYDRLPPFAAAHSGELSTRVSAVASRFLNELVRVGASFAGQTDATTPEPDIVPPQFDESSPARWYEELSEYAGKLHARALKAYRAQLDRVAAGEKTPGEVQEAATASLSRQLPDVMQAITRLYFELLDGLNDLRSVYEETYFDGLLAAAKEEEGDASVAVSLEGPSGSTVATSLSVTNTTGRRTRITHHFFDLRRVDGVGASLLPAMSVAPETLELGPDEEGTLRFALQLDPAIYDPGALYTGKFHLAGGSESPLELAVRVLATPEAAPDRGSQPPR